MARRFPWLLFSIPFILHFTGCSGDPQSSSHPSTEPSAPQEIPQPKLDPYQQSIQTLLERLLSASPTSSAPILKSLHDFYLHRSFQPAWSHTHDARPYAQALLQAIHNSHQDGLTPDDYSPRLLESQIENFYASGSHPTPEQTARLDILLSDTFIRLASDLQAGRINPSKLGQSWNRTPSLAKWNSLLEQSLQDPDASALTRALGSLAPSCSEYLGLKKALAQYREIANQGGWPLIPRPAVKTFELEPGHTFSGIPQLKQRLLATKDYQPPSGEPPNSANARYTSDLAEAVKNFQARHNLYVDGIVGEETLKALNIPVQTRITQIILNMERCRWLPSNVSPRRIQVNIPEFTLRAYDDNQKKEEMPVIVGNAARHTTTPIFNNQMEYLIICPYWNIPYNIAKNEIVPSALKDPAYMERNAYEIVSEHSADTEIFPPNPENFGLVLAGKLKMRQRTGNFNALGNLKFIFPNEHSVYLHDTNQRNLFTQHRRDFSHGCIRVSRPVDLAAYVLASQKSWTKDRIETQIESGKRQVVGLKQPIDVFIHYWTASVGEDGQIRFFEDIYGHDSRLQELLDKTVPARVAMNGILTPAP